MTASPPPYLFSPPYRVWGVECAEQLSCDVAVAGPPQQVVVADYQRGGEEVWGEDEGAGRQALPQGVAVYLDQSVFVWGKSL